MWTVNDMSLTAGALEPTFTKWNSIWAAPKVTSVPVRLCGTGEAQHLAVIHVKSENIGGSCFSDQRIFRKKYA